MTAAVHVLGGRVHVRVITPCRIAGRRRKLGDALVVGRDEAALLLADGLVIVISKPAPASIRQW